MWVTFRDFMILNHFFISQLYILFTNMEINNDFKMISKLLNSLRLKSRLRYLLNWSQTRSRTGLNQVLNSIFHGIFSGVKFIISDISLVLLLNVSLIWRSKVVGITRYFEAQTGTDFNPIFVNNTLQSHFKSESETQNRLWSFCRYFLLSSKSVRAKMSQNLN